MKRKFRVVVNGKEYTVEVEEVGGEMEQPGTVPVRTGPTARAAPTARKVSKSADAKPKVEKVEGAVTAPMPGKIQSVKVNVGDSVKRGDVLLILEAMKMENEIVAPKDGTVKEILVSPGDSVERGAPLVVIG
ncbi:MAG: biotin/lipoyl-binding protein [Euryarchaeota archaeon]|nr:biotin/lipoyl-binding protein [Euryarchaeota archaeon]